MMRLAPRVNGARSPNGASKQASTRLHSVTMKVWVFCAASNWVRNGDEMRSTQSSAWPSGGGGTASMRCCSASAKPAGSSLASQCGMK